MTEPPVSKAASAPEQSARGQAVLADAEGREQIAHALDVTLIVEASAGTGKTTMLVRRIIALLRTGTATLGRVVAVTFTEKAAGEMKLRLRSAIEAARTEADVDPVERERLDAALRELETAPIGTIHALCADLLRERPVEAEVDPVFDVLGPGSGTRLERQAFEDWYRQVVAAPPEGVRRILRRTARGSGDSPRTSMWQAARSLLDKRDFDAGWSRPEGFDRDTAIDHLMDRLAELGELADYALQADDWLPKSIYEIRGWRDDIGRREAASGSRDYDGLEAELASFNRWRHWNWKGRGRLYGRELSRDEVMQRRAVVKADLEAFLTDSEADVAALLREELRGVVSTYERLKGATGSLDFLDLLLEGRELVRGQADVRRELQERFSHILIDEFQDTDPLQAEILLLLAADDPGCSDWRQARPVPGKLFVVGDPKQSIYRFRRADPVLYQSVKARLVEQGARVVHLTTSFRSVWSIQEAINASFAPVMTGAEDGSQAEYVALERWREDSPSQPSVVALPVPEPYNPWGKLGKREIAASYPVAVAAFVDWLVNESGWTVEEASARVPIAPRHICLLSRRLQSVWEDVARPYTKALEDRQLPHVLVGGRAFHGREEVLGLRNALTAVEWPDDELAVFATLRGPFFAVPDGMLLTYRARFGRLQPLRKHERDEVAEPELETVAEALDVLGRLHRFRNWRPAADTVGELLRKTRAPIGLAIWPSGEQRLGNALRVQDLAREFEADGATSFRAFVTHLEALATDGEARDSPAVEEGTEGIRIMSVHKAKGLEFPVVILIDPGKEANSTRPSRFIDSERGLWAHSLAGCVPLELAVHKETALRHDAHEAVRLTYVAATRARDLLVLPACGDEKLSGWHDVLNPAFWPRSAAPVPAPGCPPLGGDTVRGRPEKALERAVDTIRPGLHVPSVGRHRVVWWGHEALALDRQRDLGERQHAFLAEDDAGRAAEGEERYDAWYHQRSRARAAASRAAAPAEAFTAIARRTGEDRRLIGPPIAVERVPGDRAGRPSGTRFGTLVHAVLEELLLDPTPSRLDAITEVHGRLAGATPDEVTAAADAALAALAHPLLCRALAADARHPEAPVLLKLDDGKLAEGIIDLAFREVDAQGAARWTVIDFKTDADLSERSESYTEQVRLYVRAVEAATGEPAVGVLLLV